MNPLLRQSVLVLWVVTRRGCPPSQRKLHFSTSNSRTGRTSNILLLLPPSRFQPRSPPCVLPGPGPGSWVGRASVLPVELRRPTRPPRFLPRYHTTTRSASSSTTRLARTLSLRTLGATNEVVLFRRRHEDGVRRDRVLPSIVFLIVTVAV